MVKKIKCLIRKKIINLTKEEEVRQSFLGKILYSLNYPEENIKVEVPIKDGRGEVVDVVTGKKKRADIVIYEDQSNEDIQIIVEVKNEKEQDGEAQVKSYGNKTNARYLVWNNGSDPTKIWKRVLFKNSWKWKPIPTVPVYGFEEGDHIPEKNELTEISNVAGLFKSINNYIWVNGNIKDKKGIFLQFIYILFVKLYDEYFNSKVNFYILDSEYQEINEKLSNKNFEKRITDLFNELKNSPDFNTIFDDSDNISLEPLLLAEIVYRLQFQKIRGSDKTGEAFQLFLSPWYKGENDQYLTPESVIKMILEIMSPSIKDTILDPACGTGRFLINAITQISPKLEKQKIDMKNWASSHIFGIDVDTMLVKISKIYMVLVGDGHTNISNENSLSKLVSDYTISKKSISIVVTNPPFGSKEKIKRGDILEKYKLGYEWDANLDITDVIRKQGQTQGVLMLERCYQFLNDEGKLAIVLPEGIFSNIHDEYIRKWIVENFNVLGIISLPEVTFRVETIGVNVKTSVLIAEKKSNVKNHNVFFGIPKTIGYDLQNESNDSNEVEEVSKYFFEKNNEIKAKYFRKKLTNQNLIENMAAKFHAYSLNLKDTIPLGNECDIFVGATPPKSNYLDKGKIKILKVRCLTNQIIDWSDNKRDYVTESWYDSKNPNGLDIKKYDIILASAAHVARYIGDEIDIVDEIPEKFSKVIASAKIFVIRVRNIDRLNPFELLLHLRTQKGYDQIQSKIRGQTAEIYPQDFEKFRIDKSLILSKDGKKIQEKYQNSLKKLMEGIRGMEDLDLQFEYFKHGNIQHDD